MNEIHPIEPIPNPLLEQPDFAVPPALEAEIDELITHYPKKRSASLMLLHAMQEHFGYISRQAVEWIAAKLELQPINVYELVTFYPMFRQAAGREVSLQDLPHAELRAGRLLQAARALLHEARPGPARARAADDEGREVHGRVRRVPGRLRHRAGDDVQRRLPRGRYRRKSGRDPGRLQMTHSLRIRTSHSAMGVGCPTWI